MYLSVCITTRNRPLELNACLDAVWSSTVKPNFVIVSDDSAENEMQDKNSQIVEQYYNTIYLKGPRSGVCANRNNAVNAVTDADLVAFVDDDICVEPDFIALAVAQYEKMPSTDRDHIILTGSSREPGGGELVPSSLTFRGYFHPSKTPESVVIHAAVFPRHFFREEQWDENIFFGYEDAELCLRALKRGYKILSVPELQTVNTRFQQGSLVRPSIGNLTDYEIYVEAARLYVGIKRYKDIFPNLFKLILFIGVYFAHMIVYLSKRQSIQALPKIISFSQFQTLFTQT